jgi:uncharacterized membrane protein
MNIELPKNRDHAYWQLWAMRALLVLGASHLLAGIVFFFAYNWDDLSPFAKFGLLQTGLVISVVAALRLKIESPAGQALLIAASVLTGVLFAVIGQVYQTGADAYELFTAWSVLILPWVIASRSSAHWFLWIVICLTAFSLYGGQVLVPLGTLAHDQLGIAVGAAAIASMGACELAVVAGFKWFADRWLRISLALIGVAILFVPAMMFVFDWHGISLGITVFVVAAAGLGFVYSRVIPEFAIVAIATGFAAVVSMAIGARGVHEIIGFDDGTSSLITSLIVLVLWCAMLTAATVRLLNAVHAEMTSGNGDD